MATRSRYPIAIHSQVTGADIKAVVRRGSDYYLKLRIQLIVIDGFVHILLRFIQGRRI
jgi:hypothetical protein